MATRTISTKLAIEGEAEYRQKISLVNSELRTLSSELKLVESNFAGQQNSIAALTAKGTALQSAYEKQAQKVDLATEALQKAQAAQQTYNQRVEEAKAKISASESALETLKSSTGDTTAEQKKLNDEIDKYKTEQSEAEAHSASAAKAVNRHQQELNNANIALNDFNREIQKNDQYLEEAKASTDGAATSIDRYGNEVKQTAAETENATEKTGLLGKIFAGGFFANIATQALNSIVNKLKEFGRQAISTADQAGTIAEQVGLSAARIQELTYAGAGLDVSLETITGSWKRLVNNIDAATAGSGAAYDAFQSLGVSIYDSNKKLRDSQAVFSDVIDALGSVTNATERDTIAQNILGKSATDLNPLIKAGSVELKRLSEEAENTGAVMSDRAVRALDEFGENLDFMKQRAIAFVGEGLAAVISGAESASDQLNDLNSTISNDNATLDLIAKYRELSVELKGAGLTGTETAKISAQLADVQQQLIDVSGGLVTAVGLETGAFGGQVDVLESLTAEDRELAKQKLLNLIAENTSSTAIEKKNSLQDKSGKLTEKLAAATARQTEAEMALADTTGMNSDEIAEWKSKLESAGLESDRYRKRIGKVGSELAGLEESEAAAGDAVRALSEQYGMSAQEISDYTGLALSAVQEALADTGVSDYVSGISDSLQSLADEYAAAAEGARASLQAQTGLFASMDNETSISANDVLANLQNQQTWLTNYYDNLVALEGRQIPGVDTSALVASLSDGTSQSAALLASLATSSDEDIAKIVEAMSGVNVGTDKLSEELGRVQTEYDTKLGEIVDSATAAAGDMDVSDSTREAAIRSVAAYIDGLDTESAALQAALNRLSNMARAALGANAPTRVTVSGHIAQYASGTNSSDDTFIAGENGPELVSGMPGARVWTAQQTAQILSYSRALSGAGSQRPAVNIVINTQKMDNAMVDYVIQQANKRLGDVI